MPNGAQEDVTSTLSELERKLVDLERELQSVAGGPPSRADVAVAVDTPTALGIAAPPAEASIRIGDLRSQIAELVAFRDQLQATARELVDEYGRLIDRLQGAHSLDGAGEAATGPIAPGMAVPPAGTVTTAAGITITSPPAPAPAWTPPPAGVPAWAPPGTTPYAPLPATPEEAGPTFEGAVVVDAGPFNDITTLSAFEQALARVPGAEDVYVRSFEGNRAVIDLHLQGPVRLVEELKNTLSLPMYVREARDGRLSVDVEADSHGT
jgi:hypothetical protein